MRQSVATPLDDLVEKKWDTQLFNSKDGLATMLGWRLNYHTLRSKGSRSGFPDRVLIRDRIIFAELKTEKGKPSDKQVEFLDGLARAGGEVYLWRPSDFEEIGRILSKRWRFDIGTDLAPPSLRLVANSNEVWRPGSLWVPEVGRYDSIKPEEPEHPEQLAIP